MNSHRQNDVNKNLTDVGCRIILIDQVTNVLPAVNALGRRPPLQCPVAGEHKKDAKAKLRFEISPKMPFTTQTIHVLPFTYKRAEIHWGQNNSFRIQSHSYKSYLFHLIFIIS